jgi:hypothetical protein
MELCLFEEGIVIRVRTSGQTLYGVRESNLAKKLKGAKSWLFETAVFVVSFGFELDKIGSQSHCLQAYYMSASFKTNNLICSF